MDVEGLAQVLHRHCGALDVPSGVPDAPRRVPELEVARLLRAPQREVGRVAFVRIDLDASAGDTLLRRLDVETGAVAGEGRRVEVHAIRRRVRVSLVDEPLDER